MKRSKIKQRAEELNATLTKPEHWGSGVKEVRCISPDGYWFCEGSCQEMVAQYYPDFGESVSDAYEDIYQRLQFGIEEIPQESKYLYN